MTKRPFVVVVVHNSTTPATRLYFASRAAADKRAGMYRRAADRFNVRSVDVADMRVAP